MKNLRRKASPALMALLVGGTGLAGLAQLMDGPAHADPAYASTAANMVGVGSDTIQDVFDAYTGADPYPAFTNTATQKSNFFVPLHAAGTNNAVVSSFDAIPAGGSASAPGCITTKLGGPSFDRPNGSSNGINALLATTGTTGWEASAATTCTNALVNVQGQIDFARSSRGAKTTGTTLTFIPMARDAVSFAYFDHSTGVVSSLTTAQLNSLYSSPTGTITVGADTVKACLMQSGSGTRSFWESAIAVTDAQADAAATAAGCNGQEENGGNSFYTFASGLAAGTDAVIPFSAASWISQANGTALDRSATARTGGVDLGSITDGTTALGKPYTGTGSALSPSATFYASATYGRDTYAVVLTNKITGFTASKSLQGLFAGSTAAICQTDAANTRTQYGFLAPTRACGDTSVTGAS